MNEKGDTYKKPKDGWICFHCGEIFTTVGGAGDHFGAKSSNQVACRIKLGDERGLVMALRKAEAAIAQAVKASREATIQECVGAVERWRDNAGPPTVEGKYDTYGYGLSCATQAIKELGFDIKIPYPPKMA